MAIPVKQGQNGENCPWNWTTKNKFNFLSSPCNINLQKKKKKKNPIWLIQNCLDKNYIFIQTILSFVLSRKVNSYETGPST